MTKKLYCILFCISIVWLFSSCASVVPTEANKLKTGLFVDSGSSGAGTARWVLMLHHSPDIELHLLDGKDVIDGKLQGLDLLVMPGGSSVTQYKSLQKTVGAAKIQEYVRNGGRYFGTCAGMSITLNEENRVTMMPYQRVAKRSTAGVTARVKLTPEGEKLLALPNIQNIRYHLGPIVTPTEPLPDCTCTVLATFDSDCIQKQPTFSFMYGTPAIFWLTYGKGKLFITNCHPEIYTQTHPIITRGIELLTNKNISLVYPQKKKGATRVAFLCYSMPGKQYIQELLKLEARKELDVIPTTLEDVGQGCLEHVDYLYVSSSIKTNDRLFKSGRNGELIRDFVNRGGKILRANDF